MRNAAIHSVYPLFCRCLVGVERPTPTRLYPLMHLAYRGFFVAIVGVSVSFSYFLKKRKREKEGKEYRKSGLPTPTRRLFPTLNRCKPHGYCLSDESAYLRRHRLDADFSTPTPTKTGASAPDPTTVTWQLLNWR